MFNLSGNQLDSRLFGGTHVVAFDFMALDSPAPRTASPDTCSLFRGLLENRIWFGSDCVIGPP